MLKHQRLCRCIALFLLTVSLWNCSGGKSAKTSQSSDFLTSKQVLKGESSWYGRPFHGRRTASGERYNMYSLTAAHKTLPFGTLLQVTNLDNKRKVIVRVNDRGPFARNRILDLSYSAAKSLGFDRAGIASVQARIVKRVPLKY